MRAVIAVATLLVLIWAVTPSTPPLVATPVVAEGIREQRQDEHTFALRWRPVVDMPPTVETRHEPLLLVSHDPVGAARTDERQTVGATASARPRQYRRVSLRADVCARHGQRKVMVGKYRWRCRR